MSDVLAWDIETAPDLRVFCCCYGLEGKSEDEIRDAKSTRFANKRRRGGGPDSS
jgi:predicted PolB exonuclease-like 3'-5' exonuclease